MVNPTSRPVSMISRNSTLNPVIDVPLADMLRAI